MCAIQPNYLVWFFLNVELQKDTNSYQLINQPTHKIRLFQQFLNSLFYNDDTQRLFPFTYHPLKYLFAF